MDTAPAGWEGQCLHGPRGLLKTPEGGSADAHASPTWGALHTTCHPPRT